MEKFCRRKNRTLLAHSILIFIFVIGKFFSDKIFKNKDYFIFVDILTLIFLFVDIILNSVTISRYYSFDSYFFKYSVFNYFKHNENKLIKIETWLLIFNCIIFIIEFLLFLFDFYQLENCCNKHNINISNCCRKCMNPINEFFDVKNVDDKTKERTDTNENLLNNNEKKNLKELSIIKKSRIEKELSAKFKNMNEKEIEDFQKNIMKQFENKEELDVIKEEDENDNDSISNNNNNNNDYVNFKEYIINSNYIINNNDEKTQNNTTIYKNYETILKNNNEENKDYIIDEEIKNQIINLSVSKNINFSDLESEALQFQKIERKDTPQGHFGYIKKFQIKGNNKLFVLKKPLLQEENGDLNIKKQNLIKIEEINIEIELLKQFKHKNIIKCFGKRLKDNKIPCMVLENCEGGDLQTALKNNNVTNEFKIKMMKELAEALIYLHKKGYVHSDLKCDNILLDKPYNDYNYPNLKLGDFGCAVKINDKYNNGHILYRAIEAIMDDECKVTDKLDVYSYASTCYEIIKKEPPFGDNIKIFLEKLCEHGEHFPDVNSLECSIEMKKLLLICWNKNPEERPDMINVLKILNEINIF
jgi:tRNA A-37 threonylcarbamoyl transferase component Bud32